MYFALRHVDVANTLMEAITGWKMHLHLFFSIEVCSSKRGPIIVSQLLQLLSLV